MAHANRRTNQKTLAFISRRFIIQRHSHFHIILIIDLGKEIKAKCLKCGKSFTIEHGGGFRFHLLRCDKCGKTKSIIFDEIYELHQRYLKGLSGPYCIATAEHDKRVQENVDIKPIGEDEYYKQIESTAGSCKCSGKFAFDALPRCPKCRSTDITEGETIMHYD
jgi:hypothetical protein